MSTPVCHHSEYKSRFSIHLDLVQADLERRLTLQQPEPLWAAMRHGVLNGGKRIRPVLLLETMRACGAQIEKALPTAIAVELIHCYSLIHDDLPCMDNDDFRRGIPTVHKAFSEDLAILAGDALNAIAFGLLVDETQDIPDKTVLKLISGLAQAAGTQGLVTGQVEDILSTNQAPDEQTLYRIHAGKTGALFEYSAWAGALLANQPETVLKTLATYGNTLGLAFQIVDDLLDIEAESHVLGKTVGKDQAQGKMTFPLVFGIDASRKILDNKLMELDALLDSLNDTIDTSALRFLVRFVKVRES